MTHSFVLGLTAQRAEMDGNLAISCYHVPSLIKLDELWTD